MASTSTATMTESQGQTIPITLSSSSSSPSLSIPNVPYLIPSNWKRSHLSTLVNRVLNGGKGDGEEANHLTIPFDFIIDGKLLRGTIQNYLSTNGLTVEETLDIQYVPSTLPPSFQSSFEQDDWISGVDASKDGLFLTSSFDSTFRVFSSSNTTSPLLTFSTSHAASPNSSLTNALWLSDSPESSSPPSSRMITSGMDGIIRLWQFNDLLSSTSTSSDSMNLDLETPSTTPKLSNPKLLWSGLSTSSSSPVTSLSKSKSGKYLLTSTTDGCVSLFDTTKPSLSTSSNDLDFIPYDPENPTNDQEEEDEIEIEEERSRKKRKLRKTLKKSAVDQFRSLKTPETSVWHVQPSLVNVLNSKKGSQNIPGRNSRVSKVLFSKEFENEGDDENSLESCFSAGWDGCVKEWDFKEGGRSKGIKSSDRVLLCMDQLMPIGSSTSTLVTGNMDRSISVWDMRSTTTNISLQLPASHSKPVSTVKCHPLSSHLFASGSHDGSIKIWDIRSSKQALFSLNNDSNSKPKSKANGTADMNVGEGEKVLTLDWTKDGQTIISGGEDKKLNVWRGEGIGKSWQ